MKTRTLILISVISIATLSFTINSSTSKKSLVASEQINKEEVGPVGGDVLEDELTK